MRCRIEAIRAIMHLNAIELGFLIRVENVTIAMGEALMVDVEDSMSVRGAIFFGLDRGWSYGRCCAIGIGVLVRRGGIVEEVVHIFLGQKRWLKMEI